MDWRHIDSDLSEPAFTVAADEAIARARSKGLVPNTLHFYRRNRPTVSLGYFQEVEKAVNREFCKENGIQIVRRVTGGSAIYTDPGHLIYGLVLEENTLPADRTKAFGKVCGAIIHALGELGIDAVFKPANDVLVGGRKISGSAQMRRWGIVLQHGTVVLHNDQRMMTGALKMDLGKVHGRGFKPETYVTSLSEILGSQPKTELVKSALARGFENAFNVNFTESEFTDFERNHIKELVETKYGSDVWNLKR